MQPTPFKQKLLALVQRFLRIQEQNEALQKQAEEIFETPIAHKEKKDIDAIHNKIDSL